MFDQLIHLAKEQLGGQLKDAGLENDRVDSSMDVARESMQEQVKSEALGGGLGDLVSMFNGNKQVGAGDSFTTGLSKNYTDKLMSKLGLSPQMAAMVSSMVIPFLIKKFTDKETGTANDEGDLLSKLGLDTDSGLGGLLKNLGGGKEGGLGGLGGLFRK